MVVAGRHAEAFKSNYDGLADGVVILPENEECEDLGFKVLKRPIRFHRLLAWKLQNISNKVKRLKEKDLLIFAFRVAHQYCYHTPRRLHS